MKQGDVVLIWGATGGIGAYATQYVLNGGGIPVCVVSSSEKADILRRMGVEHILGGPDHLAFVLGLLLLATSPGMRS
ncbi:MAG: hypothetical protein ACO3EK_18890, partial [Alphaproteobacteria bacterium]